MTQEEYDDKMAYHLERIGELETEAYMEWVAFVAPHMQRLERRLGRKMTDDELVKFEAALASPEPGPHDGGYWSFIAELKKKGQISSYKEIPNG